MHALPTAVLGRTGLEVTRLGYGTAISRALNNDEWDGLLNSVLDMGINFVDTANDYGINFTGKPTEEQIGRCLAQRRSEYYLATKCGCSPSGEQHIWTRENAFRGLHESLRRLKADYVDVMQLHNPTVEECERGGLVDALLEMRDQGKVRWIGVSTTLPHLPVFLEWDVFDVFQVPYSAIERDHLHEAWIDRSAEAGVGIVVRGGLAHGEPAAGTGSTDTWRYFAEAKLDDLREEGESRPAFMLRFTLTNPHAHTVIVGTTYPDHLRENVQAALRGGLPADVYTEARRRLESVSIRAPEGM